MLLQKILAPRAFCWVAQATGLLFAGSLVVVVDNILHGKSNNLFELRVFSGLSSPLSVVLLLAEVLKTRDEVPATQRLRG